MAVEQTLSIIKPDGVQKNLIGEIYKRFEDAGLEIVAARMKHLTDKEAQGFYAVHRERPFFNDLVAYMTSGPVMIQVLHGEDAIAKNREIMGATNPANADPARSAPTSLRVSRKMSFTARTAPTRQRPRSPSSSAKTASARGPARARETCDW